MTAAPTSVLPDVGLPAHLVCDAELALLGVHGDGHLLGAALDASHPAVDDVPTVRLELGAAVAQQVLAAGGAVLRDEEWTPFARLVEVREDSPGPDTVVVSGALQPVRAREAGFGRGAALGPEDAAQPGERLHLVVLRRPFVDDEAQRLADAGTSADRTLVLVPSGPTSDGDVPPAALLRAAETAAATWPNAVHVRVAPLAWRDPASDTALVGRLASRVGAQDVRYVTPDDGSASARRWHEAFTALDRGDDASLPGIDPTTEAALRAWRPPRATRGLVLMFTGLSGSGKSTLARAVCEHVRSAGRTVSLLDGDVVRTMLSAGLGFDRESRERNVERIGFVAAEVARHGGVAVCAPIAPYAVSRARVRAMAREHGDFVLVHVSTPIEECERRDLKGLYAKARAGLIAEFTGVSDPYETPTDADLSVDTSQLSVDEATSTVLTFLTDGGWLSRSTL